MEQWLIDWLNLGLRWLHLITGIAWIGSSFFFNWLDASLEKPKTPKEGVEGELWMVHSGGFYNVEKMQLTPAQIPPRLHWFMWEATFTWISGFLLLVVLYYLGASAFMIDPAIADIGPATAIAVSLATLAVSWIVYDALWASPLGEKGWLPVIVSCLLWLGLAYGLTHIYGGRGAFLHVGAVMGTIMAANVWRRIIPAQRQLVAATKAGTPADARLAKAAKQRSVHNNYMTLPVVFIMISNHYPMTYGSEYNWIVLAAIALGGAMIRHFFNLRNRGRNAWWLIPAGIALVLIAAIIARPAERTLAAGTRADFAAAAGIIAARCTPCHSASPSFDGFDAPPAGVVFDTPADIARFSARIKAQAVDSETMPLGNMTGMTAGERAILGAWIAAGAKTEQAPPNRQ